MTGNQQKIIEFLTDCKLETLPASTVHEAKRALLDTLGCMIAGLDTPLGRKLVRLSGRFTDSRGATVLGGRKQVMPLFAAMCNGFMANAHDADDGHRMSRLHAGGIIIPTVLAAAEEKDCDGGKLIEAIVIGYELGLRAGMASTDGDIYYGSAYGSTFGAAAAAGWILGLYNEQIVNAMGISEMYAPNSMLMGWINSRKIPMIKEGMGWSAASGIMAAYMAGEGITGTLTIFSGREKISRIDRLGSEYEIEHRYYKPGPACRWTHAPLQTLLGIMDEHQLTVDNVAAINIRTLKKAAQLDNPEPDTMEDAQYSIPFVLGSAMIAGEFGPAQMREDKLTDPLVLEQAGKVRLEVEPEFDRVYPAQVLCVVSVTTRDRQVFSAKNRKIRGDWDMPLSDEQLTDKFAVMSQNRLSARQVETAVNRVWSINALSSVQEFIDTLHTAIKN
jgi:2-methylcitrate dehydratase PrpD